jgi:hypothetical protein
VVSGPKDRASGHPAIDPFAVVGEDVGHALSEPLALPVERPGLFVGDVEHREPVRHRASGLPETRTVRRGRGLKPSVWPCGLESFGEVGHRLHSAVDQRGPFLGIGLEQRVGIGDRIGHRGGQLPEDFDRTGAEQFLGEGEDVIVQDWTARVPRRRPAR